MGARPYDPSLGRFLAVDPIDGGSLNNYDYCGQDPVNRFDLGGTSFYDDGGEAGGPGATPPPVDPNTQTQTTSFAIGNTGSPAPPLIGVIATTASRGPNGTIVASTTVTIFDGEAEVEGEYSCDTKGFCALGSAGFSGSGIVVGVTVASYGMSKEGSLEVEVTVTADVPTVSGVVPESYVFKQSFDFTFDGI